MGCVTQRPSKWKTNVSTYDFVNLGEIYKGIDLKLKAYGDNVEKLFYVKPGADPEQIKICLRGIQPSENPPPLSPSLRGRVGCPPLAGAGGGLGARGLSVNEHGELEVETALGTVKFTKPIAYQEIDGKRVEVAVEYSIQNPEDVGWVKRSAPNKNGLNDFNGLNRWNDSDGFASLNPSYTCKMQNAEQGITHPLPLSRGEYKSPLLGRDSGVGKSAIQNVEAEVSNPKSKIVNRKFEYGFTVASYDKTKDLIIDPLLASTFLGGSGYDIGFSLTLDTSGNVYVTGDTQSTDFPTTSGAYDTSYNGGGDVFVSKLDGNLSAGTAQPPTVTTGDAADITLNSATLKGVVNANGLTAAAWFEYGTTSGGPYLNSNTQTVTGSGDTPVSIGISGLLAGTKYYYRLVAENSAGKSEGSEKSFTTSSSELMFPLENYLNWQQTQPFGNFYCQCPYNGKHLGEDRSLGEKGILAKGTPVKAIANGTVKRHRNLATLGDYVHLQHTLSDGRKITSVYYHIQKIWTGKPDVDLIEGSTVEKGKVVGYITDKRKDYGTAPHLHFGIRKGEYKEVCDPLTNVWYYPGYTTIYLCKSRVPPGRCCRDKDKYPKYDCARSCEASKRDPIHRRVINEWVDPVRFILGQVTDFEVCCNGIDDDGDTLIDSEDPDCGG